ncbi:MAG TPA: dolichyl-phosphate beta-glucosyltransferase [Thermoanaerobaculia bacterium]|nr:dolichyl-phosphate beta-glucosyltransferase [Thermoanaerobaculia bacterium]
MSSSGGTTAPRISDVSIVIPAFNEAGRLPSSLERIMEWSHRNQGVVREIIVVDDGSRDGTAEAAKRMARPETPVVLEVQPENRGKGAALRRGVLLARGAWILLTDADLSTPIEEIDRLSGSIERFDIVIGSRGLAESDIRIRQAWYRQQMGRTFNRLVRLLTGIPFRDTQCGFKLLRRSVARDIFERARIDRFAWDVEILLLAASLGYSVVEVPVSWFNSPDSRVHIVGDSTRMLVDVVKTRLRLPRWHSASSRSDGTIAD